MFITSIKNGNKYIYISKKEKKQDCFPFFKNNRYIIYLNYRSSYESGYDSVIFEYIIFYFSIAHLELRLFHETNMRYSSEIKLYNM